MKHCSYCGTEYQASQTTCPTCGASAADIKCDYCGANHKGGICPSCGFGAPPLSPEEVAAKRAAEAEAAKTRKKREIWTIVLLFIFPPVGILLTWLWMKHWSKNIKIIVSLGSAVILIAAVAYDRQSPSGQTAERTTDVAVMASTAFQGENYQKIERQLKDMGFIDVQLVPVEDAKGLLKILEGQVSDVTVDGKSVATIDDGVAKESKIAIFYHAAPKADQDEERTTADGSDWKAFLKDYEAWVDDYVKFLKKYQENPGDISLVTDYAAMTAKMATWSEDYKTLVGNLSDADLDEFTREYGRISAKIPLSVQ
jgi:hypothetical protein